MPGSWYKSGQALLTEIRDTHLAAGEAAVWYLGQCGFVFKSSTATVYIDAVLNDLTNPDGSTRRYFPPPFAPECALADYFICTHGHRDHMALPTLRAAAGACPQARFIAPLGCVPALRQAGIPDRQLEPVRAGQTLVLPGLTVRPVCAAHPEHRPDDDPGAALCYHLQMGDVTLLHLGDTYLTGPLLQALQALPAPQLLLVPVNGSDYFRTARGCIGNLNAPEAAHLAALLRADVSIPTHYDMVKGNTADPLLFAAALRREDPAAKWHVFALGERLLYRR